MAFSSMTGVRSDELQCVVCFDLYKEPITLPCGHSFCRVCIEKYWETWDCPNCRAVYPIKPNCKKNVTLASLVEQMKARPGEKLRTGEKVEEPRCTEHRRTIQLYCKDDESLMCVMCTAGQHQNHNVVAVEIVHDELKIMVHCETQKCERLNVLKRIVKKVDGRVCQMVLSERERDSDSVRFVLIERHIPSTPHLDLNSANISIMISQDLRTATITGTHQPYPEHPDRFGRYAQVVSSESFSSGRHYWEVDVSSSRWCRIGICSNSMGRKGERGECVLGENPESWCLQKRYNKYTAWHNNRYTRLSMPGDPERVGFFLDYEEGETPAFTPVTHFGYHVSFFAFQSPIITKTSPLGTCTTSSCNFP
uniref:Uncharacterized protein n=1 Tax=Eptatretus burgeri TaxID=7764 RepID=A0A8C4QV43_EPTBU